MEDKKKNGRPTKLNKKTQDAIVAFLRLGSYVETAAAAAGVSKVSLYAWLKRGATQSRGKYRNFLNAVMEAQSTAVIRDLATVDAAANGYKMEVTKITIENGKEVSRVTENKVERDWRAAAWRLERRNQKQWGNKQDVTIHDPEEKKPASKQTPEQRDAELARLRLINDITQDE